MDRNPRPIPKPNPHRIELIKRKKRMTEARVDLAFNMFKMGLMGFVTVGWILMDIFFGAKLQGGFVSVFILMLIIFIFLLLEVKKGATQ